ncbi:hypothetical protein [Streptomyces sp. MB09-02B]|uniref:hypothetical protein n=1 Tax=Streptomyces sp. MB09-02B TaxID=3028667 RepID=UPI0029B29585|nr:hypothetical protein [Streptomyces sp. MB09-02B]MDX3643121.1 hypothetical protein [Streptomyces sp. MB09-02B]
MRAPTAGARARDFARARAWVLRITTLARRYGVRWLLLTRWQKVPEEAVVVDWSPRTGEVPARIAP